MCVLILLSETLVGLRFGCDLNDSRSLNSSPGCFAPVPVLYCDSSWLWPISSKTTREGTWLRNI